MTTGASNAKASAQKLENRELWAWILAALAIAGLVTMFVTMPPSGPIRVRYFNGANSDGVPVRVQAYKAEGDTDPKIEKAWAAAQLPAWRYAFDNLDADDYLRFDLRLDNVLAKSFKITDIKAVDPTATKLGEMLISRIERGGGYKHTVIVSYVSGTGDTANKAIVWDEP